MQVKYQHVDAMCRLAGKTSVTDSESADTCTKGTNGCPTGLEFLENMEFHQY